MGIDFEEEFKDMLLNFDDCSDDSTDDDAKGLRNKRGHVSHITSHFCDTMC